MEFAYLFRALMRRKWIIIGCVVVALVSAYLFTMNSKKLYRSTAQLSTGFTLIEGLKLEDERFSLPQIDVKFNNAIENITSPKVLTLVSYNLLLHDLQSQTSFTTLTPKEKGKPEFKQFDRQKAVVILQGKLDSALLLSPTNPDERSILNYLILHAYDVGALRKGLRVARDQRTDYINILFFSENPYLSAFVVNTLCKEFRRFYGIDRRERTDVSIVMLDSLLKAKKALLDQKVHDKNLFMSKEGVLDVNQEGANKLSQISTFEGQLIEAQSQLKEWTYRLQQLSSLLTTARAKGLNTVSAPINTSNSGTNGDYLRLRREYNDLNAEYKLKGSNDPVIKAKLDDLTNKMSKLSFASQEESTGNESGLITIDQLVQKKIDAEAQLKAINQRISGINSKLAQLNGGLTGMAAKGANIQQMNKEIEIAQTEYTEAKDRLNIALNLNDNSSGNFKQTIMGEPAPRPEPSKRMTILALSGLCAFFLSSLSIVGIEFFDQSIKTPSQFQRQTRLHLLGTINTAKLSGNNILDKNTFFDEKENRSNTFRELLRKLRYEILNSNRKIFLFTSTEPQQGKTTLIQSLAYSLSLSKKKVLIIDTNFCNNDLTKAVNANPVLEKFSVNGKPFEPSDVQSLITETSTEGVDVIGCEGGDYTPSEILPRNHLLNFLEPLKSEYDFILMEGAPLNGFTDTKELIRYADGLIAVFSAETVLTAADMDSIEFLKENNDKFLGAILNKVQEPNLDM